MNIKNLVKIIKETASQAVNQTASQRHGSLYEFGVAAHINRILRGGDTVESQDYPEGGNEKLKSIARAYNRVFRTKTQKNPRSRLPRFSKLGTTAAEDAQTLVNTLRPKHGWTKESRAHWTPNQAARSQLHKGVNHSGDIVIKGTTDSAINLKWGKGTSSPSPTHDEIMKHLHPEGSQHRQAAENAFDEIRKSEEEKRNIISTPSHPQWQQNKQRRDSAYRALAQAHANAFNSLDDHGKREFLRKFYGTSSSPEKLSTYTFHSGSSGPKNNQSDFDNEVREGSKIEAVPHGRGVRFMRKNVEDGETGKRLKTLSYRGRTSGEISPNAK